MRETATASAAAAVADMLTKFNYGVENIADVNGAEEGIDEIIRRRVASLGRHNQITVPLRSRSLSVAVAVPDSCTPVLAAT